MNELKVIIGILKNGVESIVNPYWFTRDKAIHISADVRTAVVKMEELSRDTLIEIYNGVKDGLITIEGDLDKLNELIKTAVFGATPPPQVVPPVKDPVDLTTQNALKLQIATLNADKESLSILDKSMPDIKSYIGAGALGEDGSIPKGCDDLLILTAIAANETAKKKRKIILDAVKERISLVEQYGLHVSPVEGVEVEESEQQKLIYNPETKTLDPINDGQ